MNTGNTVAPHRSDMTKNFTYRPSPTALLDPCRDSIFKKLFTDNSPEGSKALQSFLEAVLGKSVSNIVLQPTELPIEDAFDKQARFDLNCKIDNSEYANIEIQGINTEKSFEKRAEYYCAHLLNHNVPSGLKWQEVPKVYQISVLKFIREKNSEKEIFHYKFRTEEGYSLHDRQNIIFIELPKVEELVKKIEAEQMKIEDLTDTQKWSIFILYASKEEHNNIIKKISNSEGGIMCAVQILDKISQDEIEWKRQFDEFMIETDRRSLEQFYKDKGMEIGLAEGREQGKEEGLQQGLQQGLEQGIKQSKIEIAKKSLEKKLPMETISEITGLSIKEIQDLNK